MTQPKLFGGGPVMMFTDDRSRRSFLKWAGLLGVGATLAAAGARSRFASAQGDEGDIGILNYALALEYLEEDFYGRGADSGLLTGRAGELVAAIRNHETEHVAALESTISDLGGTPVKKPKFSYPQGVFKDKKVWLETALDFSQLGVKAYHGQVQLIQSPELLGAAASIAGVESRHAAVIAHLAGRNPFPAPLEQSFTKGRVLKTVKPFISG
ncbi:MAG: ferritin-like domain-containing protein [Actinomycetota bacterium]|nr:ferritin-like domain-containing protein [Actinomycetota bacterium]